MQGNIHIGRPGGAGIIIPLVPVHAGGIAVFPIHSYHECVARERNHITKVVTRIGVESCLEQG